MAGAHVYPLTEIGLKNFLRILLPATRGKTRSDLLWTLATQLINVAAGVAIAKLIGRLVPSTEYGNAALVLGVAALLNVFGGNPLVYAFTRQIFEHRRASTEVAFVRATERFFLLLALGLAAAYVLFAFASRAAGNGIYLQSAFAAVLLVFGQLFFNLRGAALESASRFRASSAANAGLKLLNVALLFALVKVMSGTRAVLFAVAIASACIAVVLRPRARETGAPFPMRAAARELFNGFGSYLYLANLAAWVISTSDRYLVQHFRSGAEVGIYVLNYALWSMPFNTLSSWAESYSRVRTYHAASLGNRKGVVRQMRLRLLLSGGLAIAGAAVIMLIARPVALFILGARYWYGLRLVALLTGAHVFVVLGNSAVPVFLAGRETSALARIGIVAAVLNVGLNLIVVPRFGIIGAAASTLVSYAVWSGLVIASANKRLR